MADPQKQFLGRVKMKEPYKFVMQGQAGTLQSVDNDEMATVNFDWTTIPSTMAGTMKPSPNIDAVVPYNLLIAVDDPPVPV